MKTLSWNVNGLRAVHKRNFSSWLASSQADIVCLQEIKATEDKIPPELVDPGAYRSYFCCAEKRGYSGVAVYTKTKPRTVVGKLGHERFDKEGRLLQLEFPAFTLLNVYLPQGGRMKENLAYKLEVYDALRDYLKKLLKRQPRIILVGDLNIARAEIDLARPKENMNNIMFTPEEREKLEALFSAGFEDSFRRFHEEGGNYTWWPYFANARERNIGWRIDYGLVSRGLVPKLVDANIYPKVIGSDHCPIGVTWE